MGCGGLVPPATAAHRSTRRRAVANRGTTSTTRAREHPSSSSFSVLPPPTARPPPVLLLCAMLTQPAMRLLGALHRAHCYFPSHSPRGPPPATGLTLPPLLTLPLPNGGRGVWWGVVTAAAMFTSGGCRTTSPRAISSRCSHSKVPSGARGLPVARFQVGWSPRAHTQN